MSFIIVMFGKKRLPEIPGFVPICDQILVRDAPGLEPIPAHHPSAILIYGWGDCLPKHVAKYCEGFQDLFPRSRQIVVLAPISKALFSSISARTEHMNPVLDSLGSLILPETPKTNGIHIMNVGSTHSSADACEADTDSMAATMTEKLLTIPNTTAPILVHAISSTGLTNYASTLNAYRLRYGQPLPHQLLICDSTPGSPVCSHKNLTSWSRAMAMGAAKFFPWPFIITHSILYVLLWIHVFWLFITGQEHSGGFTVRSVDDETLETKQAKRMFMYSKEDNLIMAEDIEELSEDTSRKGYDIRRELFVGSAHVKHMQKFPEQYWRAIDDAWRWSAEVRRGGEQQFKVEVGVVERYVV